MSTFVPRRHTYRMTIAYDGTEYSGWQEQPHVSTIQQQIQDALAVILKVRVPVIGSGRTDAGVHAQEQVAHFRTNDAVDTAKTLRSLNGILPPDIRIIHMEEADRTFHAQLNATGKIYHYHLCFSPVQSPLRRKYQYHYRHKIDLDLLRKSATRFVGTHDFTAFANSPREGCVAKNPIRTIYRLDVVEEENGVRLEFEGNGFLYKMVRNIVGTLLDVARGKRPISEIDAAFAARDRRRGGRAAPPRGLFLVGVKYEE